MTARALPDPGPVATSVLLPARVWRPRARAHAARADALTAAHRERRATGRRHPVEDFLFDYYGLTPARLRRWHPGPGVRLAPGRPDPADRTDPADGTAPPQVPEHAGRRWYRTDDDGAVSLDVATFLGDRGSTVRYVHHLLTATASRPAFAGCFGLHEWAMVYRRREHRHDLPLRLGQDATDEVVESHRLRCTHIDAFRFFTPDAAPRNGVQPTRETQPELEQPGCLHANMDLLKWSLKLGPATPGDLLLDCFELARDLRRLDMQASPYDVSSLGEPAVAIETPQGKAEYVDRQRRLADRAAPLRARVAEVCALLLEDA